MPDITFYTFVLQNLQKEWKRLADRLGGNSEAVAAQLAKIMLAFDRSEEVELKLLVDKLLEFGLRSSAKDIFQEVLQRSRYQQMTRGQSYSPFGEVASPGSLNELREVLRTTPLDKGLLSIDRDIPSSDWGVSSSDRGIDGAARGRTGARGVSPSDGGRPITHAKHEGQSPRYLNAGFFNAHDDNPLSSDAPLALDGGPYRLGVNVGEFWGPGTPEAPFPTNLLEPYFEDEATLELDILARSPGAAITPAHKTLRLAPSGNSALTFFGLTFLHAGRHEISIDLIFRGHLLQSRRVEAEVVARTGDVLPPSAWPLQNGHITFTRTAALDPASLAPLAERPSTLTIVAERSLDRATIGLRFYDTTGAELAFQETNLTDVNLGSAMGAIRRQLALTMQAYTGAIGSSREILEKHLGLLAEQGRRFYRALLGGAGQPPQGPDGGEQLKAQLKPGAVIQVAPLSAQLGVPWELLYERPFESYRPGRTRLCPTFLEHGLAPEDCPGQGDPALVCPHGFWGYRYQIEQLPCRVPPNGPLPGASLPFYICNELPLQFSAVVCTSATLQQVEPHLAELEKLATAAQLDLKRVDSLDKLQAALSQASPLADVVYFYTHGGQDAAGSPYLEVGAGDQVKENDFDAWAVDLSQHRPLVVFNACESADYSPDNFENLIKLFCDRGAAGVIGTQCETKENLARFLMVQFFQAFLNKKTAGEALFDARQTLLHKLDPRGLAYGLFALAEVKLAKPII